MDVLPPVHHQKKQDSRSDHPADEGCNGRPSGFHVQPVNKDPIQEDIASIVHQGDQHGCGRIAHGPHEPCAGVINSQERIGAGGDTTLAEIFGAVEHFGLSVYRVNTVTFETEGEEETYFSVVVKDCGVSFAPLLTYFALFLRDFVPVGIYKNLE